MKILAEIPLKTSIQANRIVFIMQIYKMKKQLPTNRRNRRQLKNEIKYLYNCIQNDLLDYRIDISNRKRDYLLYKTKYNNTKDILEMYQQKDKDWHLNWTYVQDNLERQKKETAKYRFWAIFWAAITVIFMALFIITGFIQILLSI